MEQKRKGSMWVIVLSMVALLALCVGGMLLPGKELPEISMAPERIPLPFALPLVGSEIPNTLPPTWLSMIVLLVIGLLYRRGVQAAERTGRSNRLVAAIEEIIDIVYKFIINITGPEKGRIFFPLVATFFFFILVNNWMGLLPGFGTIGVWAEHHGETIMVPFLRSANADLSTTVALGLISIVAVQFFGFRFQGTQYLKKFFNFTAPKEVTGAVRPILVIANGFAGLLELISEIIKIFSFAFRLFGNIFAGEVLLIVVMFLAAFVAVLPFMGLELFVGIVQALVFSMLSLIFFMMATEHHGGEHHDEHHA